MVRHSSAYWLTAFVVIAQLSAAPQMIAPANATSSNAAACQQDNARYLDPESGLELTFKPLQEDDRFLQSFTVSSAKSEVTLDSFITLMGEPLRPVAFVVNQCPDGDITGEELSACTVWQGVPYALFGDGSIGLLPESSAPAVTQILLPDFARSVMSHKIWDTFNSEEPFEVFDFKDCGE
jgi:hypothetical protein